MNYELGGERTNGLLAVALWCCGAARPKRSRGASVPLAGPLVIFLVLTLLLVSVFTASNYDELANADSDCLHASG